ncbi:hypothetical protein Vretifemale_8717 [Volvox reticuliferus]|uniref:Uncharacterized protein n=1 Tax=Volvox reticuliferus TaxID=1737510 RepID=A0A8J4CD28_9CHLO|nr:hypothetical protein Vretifemale_8717 [Volvox reticuliferus]
MMLLDQKLRVAVHMRVARRSQSVGSPSCPPRPLRLPCKISSCSLGRQRLVSRSGVSTAETTQQVLEESPEAGLPYPVKSLTDTHDDNDCEAGPGPRSSSQIGPDVSFVSLVDGKYTVRGQLLLPVSAPRVFTLLTDYEGCHRVFGNIAGSEVIRSKEGGLQVVQVRRF